MTESADNGRPTGSVKRGCDRVGARDAEHPDSLGVQAAERKTGGEVVPKRGAPVAQLLIGAASD